MRYLLDVDRQDHAIRTSQAYQDSHAGLLCEVLLVKQLCEGT